MGDLAGLVQPQSGRRPQDLIDRALATVKSHLGMEVAYLSEFIDDESLIFRALDAPHLAHVAQVGTTWPIQNAYCKMVATGELPELIPNTDAIDLCQLIPATRDLPIKSHVSVPIRRADGSIYGMFCCLSHEAKPGLNERDLAVMKTFADLSGEQVRTSLHRRLEYDRIRDSIRACLAADGFKVVYQPIRDIATNRTSGFEALCRFAAEPYRSPDKWFADAGTVGLAIDLEIAVIQRALEALPHLPGDIYLSVNASPATVASGRLADAFTGQPLERIVLEITEHTDVQNEKRLIDEVLLWRYRGVNIAIDDAGAGYSGLQKIVRLSPDLLKLDMSLTQGIDRDPVRRSLAAAMVHFATETSAKIIAEGVETEAELAVIRALGVHRGQGWFFGRPEELDAALARLKDEDATRVA